MRFAFIFGVVCCSSACYHSYSQGKIDSLHETLKGANQDRRYSALVGIARYYGNEMGKYDSAVKYLRAAYQIAKRKGDTLKIAETGRMFSAAFDGANEGDSVIKIANEVLPLAKKSHAWEILAKLYNQMGVIYTYYGQFDRALEYHLMSLELREKLEMSDVNLMLSLSNTGLVYYKLGDNNKAIEYFLRALSKGNINDPDNVEMTNYIVRLNLATVYAETKNFKEAKKYLDQVTKDYERGHRVDWHTLLLQVAQGIYYYDIDSLATAASHFRTGIGIALRTNNVRCAYDCYDYLAKIYFKQGAVKNALDELRKAENLTRKVMIKQDMLDIYEQYIKIFKHQHEITKLIEYQQKYISLKDSIYNEQLTANLIQLHAEATDREISARIEDQKQLLAAGKSVVDKRRIVNLLIGLAASILLIIIYLLFRMYISRQRVGYLLNKKIIERTKELTSMNESFQTMLIEQTESFTAMRKDVRSATAEIREICAGVLQGSVDATSAMYFKKIDITTSKLSEVVSGN